ncbi:hypothetical protein LPJ59_001105 [Coemansia sp. RSA 2399]|nr:hypothetical protein LPJ59_001105 [Coemansia sp. RSA 2399]KAJ1907019.1 hypothetical protein LPJ81_001020 [Coemansia sp. IMI 209127]
MDLRLRIHKWWQLLKQHDASGASVNEHAKKHKIHTLSLDEIEQTFPAHLLAASKAEACLVCFEPLGRCVRALSCGHSFHAGCIDPWLSGSAATCPTCRRLLFPFYSENMD